MCMQVTTTEQVLNDCSGDELMVCVCVCVTLCVCVCVCPPPGRLRIFQCLTVCPSLSASIYFSVSLSPRICKITYNNALAQVYDCTKYY